jgi:Leucine-rich repeat (LRR) protein
MVLPEGIGRLAYLPRPGLKKLDLRHNAQLAELEELHLQGCRLTALPEGIGRLARLRRLLLGGNRELMALPDGLWSLTGLEELDLGSSGLTALPEGIGQLVGLWGLDLNNNHELTALPAGLGRLCNLEVLDLYFCAGLAALLDLQRRKGMPALLAHLATQREPAAAEGQL